MTLSSQATRSTLSLEHELSENLCPVFGIMLSRLRAAGCGPAPAPAKNSAFFAALRDNSCGRNRAQGRIAAALKWGLGLEIRQPIRVKSLRRGPERKDEFHASYASDAMRRDRPDLIRRICRRAVGHDRRGHEPAQRARDQ